MELGGEGLCCYKVFLGKPHPHHAWVLAGAQGGTPVSAFAEPGALESRSLRGPRCRIAGSREALPLRAMYPSPRWW